MIVTASATSVHLAHQQHESKFASGEIATQSKQRVPPYVSLCHAESIHVYMENLAITKALRWNDIDMSDDALRRMIVYEFRLWRRLGWRVTLLKHYWFHLHRSPNVSKLARTLLKSAVQPFRNIEVVVNSTLRALSGFLPD